MNARERFLNTMHFKGTDRCPWWEMWYWGDTLQRWYGEGLPRDVHLIEYFGVDRRESIGINQGLVPGFEEKTIEETDEYRVFVRSDGVKCKQFKTGGVRTMPHWIEFPVKDRASWNEFRKRLDPHSPVRYPLWWEEKKMIWANRDYPLSIGGGSLYGWPRNWIGMENLAVMFYDDPMLVHDIMEYLTEFIIATVQKAVQEVRIDYVLMWEDMSFKSGPLISPKLVREFMLPRYKRIVNVFRSAGIDAIFVDSDGNVDELIPIWLEAGINGTYPLEIAAGTDIVALRKKYGRDLLMIGGIDKRAMAAGPEAIRRELLSKLPFMAKQGGYIPWCDHLVPPDVSFRNYMYYLNLMKDITLDPDRYAYEAEREGLARW
ncbi:MAG: hypothetical protein N3A38_10940 [Planctomycetota bacterium]|nr:hypothetical protein [Planctomycetota bacterium]